VADPASKGDHSELIDPEPSEFPPEWASAWGEDAYGRYAEIQVQGITQRFRWIVPGTFWMGSPEDEAGREDSEAIHPVTLSQGFWLADSTVAQGLFEAVMGTNPSRFTDDARLPVETVSWDDAIAFCAALNRRVPGLEAGLPSEAQWEYACRAGTPTTRPFSFGDTITPEQVNYNGNYPYGNGKKGLYRERTVPVGSLPPNAWGLHEMHGNLWEWCSDWFGPYSVNTRDPEGPAEGSSRVLRGGSWIGSAVGARSAQRGAIDPGSRGGGVGFRLAPGRWGAGPAERGESGKTEREPSRGTREGAREVGGATFDERGEAPSILVEHAGPWLQGLAERLRRLQTERSGDAGDDGDIRAAERLVAEVLRRLESAEITFPLVEMGLTGERLAEGVNSLANYLERFNGSELVRQILHLEPAVTAILRGERGADWRERLAISGVLGMLGMDKEEKSGSSPKPRQRKPSNDDGGK
jgi:sulfatase modifying factor 1